MSFCSTKKPVVLIFDLDIFVLQTSGRLADSDLNSYAIISPAFARASAPARLVGVKHGLIGARAQSPQFLGSQYSTDDNLRPQNDDKLRQKGICLGRRRQSKASWGAANGRGTTFFETAAQRQGLVPPIPT